MPFTVPTWVCWVERAIFATPYSHGLVRLSPEMPATMELATGGKCVFLAVMGSPDSTSPRPREPSSLSEAGWDGPVYLPMQDTKQDWGKMFFAKATGKTDVYPFVPGDAVTIRPDRAGGVLAALLDSGFAATAWEIRRDATHAKSKTYTWTP